MKALPKIPGYELLTCLGGGVITTVYSARQCETDCPCAIKVLRPDWEDQPVALKLLQREARAGLSVQHPHLVRILEAQRIISLNTLFQLADHFDAVSRGEKPRLPPG